MTRAATSLVGQPHLVTKIYMPRVLIPISSVVAALVDLAVALGVMLGLMVAYGVWPSANLLALPLFLLLITVAASAVSLSVSALAVYYRDFVYAMPFLIQVWMYVTPVVFPASLVPERWRWVFAINPMVAAIEGVRWATLGRGTITWSMVALSTTVSLGILLGGLLFLSTSREKLL